MIRKYKILNRLPKTIEKYKKEVNRICIRMTHARRSKEAASKRKGILREFKQLCKQIGQHGQKHLQKLESEWAESNLSLKEKEHISGKLSALLDLEDKIIQQAHERIIGGRPLKNEDKILSIYDLDLEVIKRGKAGKEVEFGNKFYISENEQGYILDYSLSKGNPDDRKLLLESLDRQEEAGQSLPRSICGDRGFNGINTTKPLTQREIEDFSCPKGVDELNKKMESLEFVKQQTRRAGTEARISILKNKFSLSGLRSIGFINRNRSCNWAVISHNLWVIARQVIKEKEQKEAA